MPTGALHLISLANRRLWLFLLNVLDACKKAEKLGQPCLHNMTQSV